MSDLYREEEEAQFRAFLPPLRQLLEVCAESVGKAAETADIDQSRLIVERVIDTLDGLIRQTKSEGRAFLRRLDPPKPPIG